MIAELLRDVRRTSDLVPLVEYPSFVIVTDSNGAIEELKVKLTRVTKPKSVTVAKIHDASDRRALVAGSFINWDFDGKDLIFRGIGDLVSSTTFAVTLRVEGS